MRKRLAFRSSGYDIEGYRQLLLCSHFLSDFIAISVGSCFESPRISGARVGVSLCSPRFEDSGRCESVSLASSFLVAEKAKQGLDAATEVNLRVAWLWIKQKVQEGMVFVRCSGYRQFCMKQSQQPNIWFLAVQGKLLGRRFCVRSKWKSRCSLLT